MVQPTAKGRWTRRAVAEAAISQHRVDQHAGLCALLQHPSKDRGAWAIWVPAMTLDRSPSMLAVLPWVSAACVLGLVISYWLLDSLTEHRRLREVRVGPKPGAAVVFESHAYANSSIGIVSVEL